MFEQSYKKFDVWLSRQARFEVALHIAFDRGIINGVDVSLMRDYPKQCCRAKKGLKISRHR